MGVSPGFKTDSPFVRFLASKGYHAAGKLGVFRNIGRRLALAPDKVAPNSPILPPFAEFLEIPLKTLQKFAGGAPMSEQFVRKIRIQMEKDTLTRGARRERKLKKVPTPSDSEERNGRGNYLKVTKNATAFRRYVVTAHNIDLTPLARRASIPISMMWRVSCGQIAPNHPVLTVIANALNVDVSEIVKFCNPDETPLKGNHIKAAEKLVKRYLATGGKSRDRRKPGTSLVPVPTPHANANGNGHHAAVVYNRLGSKRTQLELREAARTMVGTLNVAIMNGDTHIPPLTIQEVYLVLVDYLQEKGVKDNVIVHPNFARLFDPKS